MKAFPGNMTVKETLTPFASLKEMPILMTKQGNILNFIRMNKDAYTWQGNRCTVFQLSYLTGKARNPFKSSYVPGEADPLNYLTKNSFGC
jgi:hypothetical protein